MEPKNFEGRQTWNEKFYKDDDFEDDNEEEESGGKKLGAISGSKVPPNGGGMPGLVPCCQAERCGANLTDAKRYHRRHKVCEFHSKAPIVIVSGLPQRFCQQCSRFHEVSEFDEAKRSCRRRLAGHNERRRKSSVESHGEGSSRRGSRESQTRQIDDQRSRVQITQSVNSTYKHLHIR